MVISDLFKLKPFWCRFSHSIESGNLKKFTANPFKPVELTGYLRSFGGSFPPLRPVTLPASLFAAPARLDVIHRVICWFRAGERAGLASSKGRGEVAGSGRKIHPQKGTGRARAGDSRAPHRRGGTLKIIIIIADCIFYLLIKNCCFVFLNLSL